MTTTYSTHRDIIDAIDAIKATLPWAVKTGLTVTPKCSDGVRDGQVVTTYGVVVRLAAMGSGESRTVWAGEAVDLAAMIADMRKALAARNNRTRGAIRAERSRS